MECKIVIPSMGRHDNVLTKKVIANAIICVPESQKKIYEDHNKNEVIAHPDSIKGLSLKRQWIYEYFGDVLMLDDDLTGMSRLYISKGESNVVSKKDVYDIVQMVYRNAKNAGVYLWGFSHLPNTIMYSPFKPIRLTGYITGCAMGLIAGAKFKFEQNTAVEDFYISCINAYYHRMIWKDTRFYFVQKETMTSVGGLANYRTIETEKQDTIWLRKKFGDVISMKAETSGGGKSLNTAINQYARTMTIPF